MSSSEPARRRVFIECTHTYFVGGNSGIRRVARSLANAHREASDDRVQLLPLIWAGHRFLCPRRPLTENPHPLLQWRERILALPALATQGLSRCFAVTTRVISTAARLPLLAALREPVKSALRKAWVPVRALLSPLARLPRKLRQWLRRGSDNREALYRLFGLLAWPWGLPFLEPVRFRRGDIVVLVDSTWDSPAMLETLCSARRRDGIQVGAMLHDLFPLTIPQMCQACTVADYIAWFQRVVVGVDFFITNSAATTRALKDQLEKRQLRSAQRLPVGNFRLGAEWHQSAAVPGPNPLTALQSFVVLAVGTIEPRKNYAVILDALDLLWAKYDVTLVIVGRLGWSNAEIMARVREHGLGGTKLLHLDDADDAALTASYQRADALVCASWAEGFGLPIVEGLRHGLPVVASDIEAFREVGGDACRYFAPDRPEELAAQLEQLVQQWLAGTPVRLEKYELAISWRESAIQFRDEVLRLAAASRSTASVSVAARSQE